MSTNKAKKKKDSIDFFIADMDSGEVTKASDKPTPKVWHSLSELNKSPDSTATSPQNETSISDGNGVRIDLEQDKDKIVKK